MTIQVYRSEKHADTEGSGWGRHFLLDTARALSQHPDWEIIDSYAASAVPDRVKGDPIVDNLWGGLDEGSINSNSWFVAEQKNPETGFPAMQVKFQGTEGSGFDDPSGNDYGWEGSTYMFAARLAPFGGWDLADVNPDFANPTKVSKNLSLECDGEPDQWFWVIGDDFILMPQLGGSGLSWSNVACYIGKYNPMTAGQHTPEHPCYMYFGHDNNGQRSPAYWVSISDEWFLNHIPIWYTGALIKYFFVTCPDENGLMKRWVLHCPLLNNFFGQMRAFNEFDQVPGVDLLEVPICGIEITTDADSPDTRMIGSHKYCWFGVGRGPGAFIGDKEYLALGANQTCVVIPWDGATALTP